MDKLRKLLEANLTLPYVLGIGISLRLLMLFFYPDQNFPDTQGYIQAGKAFFETGVIGSSLHMPLYIIWTHLMGDEIWVKVSDIIMSVFSIYFIYFLSLEIFKDKLAALLSALISAVYPHFLFYAVSRLTETSFIALILLAFLLLYREKYCWASIVLVLSILIRPTFDLLNPFLIFSFVFWVRSASFLKAIKKVFLYGGIYIILMTPWWTHNYITYGEFVRLNLADGHVLYSGNNPKNTQGGGVSWNKDVDDVNMSEFQSISNPIERNNSLKQAAVKFIKNNPKHFLKLSWVKFMRFWRLWPYASEYLNWKTILVSLLSYGVILLASLTFIFLYGKSYFRQLLPVYLCVIYLTLVHIVTIGSIRYRLPLEPFLLILAGFIFMKLLRLKERK